MNVAGPFLIVRWMNWFWGGSILAASGLVLGAGIGLVQDAVSHLPFGVYGIALTAVGCLATWIGYRIDSDLALSRFGVTFLLYDVERGVIALIRRFLLERPGPFLGRYWLIGSVVTATLAVVIFPQLGRLRKS